ncbi:hypothetical protein DDM70_11995 [Vibrio cholerae]|uniref:hypothetical protein n=1 Tax=Vibrio cholerae TaxID=666 RepID=UPI00155E974A|nr:hypothetical protein [Vibrio cholerae]EGR4373094.1 hypothetical protein [Vibrio cholerae]NOE37279.1 hypothetical protein [Vibrio cholerae]
MELNEKAKVAALYQELSKADVSDPNKLVGQLESAAKSIVQSMNSHPIKDEQMKTSVFDHAHMNEQYRQLSEQQMKIVDSVQLLIKQVESMGHEKPTQDNWLSKTLSNYQRGYLENDIFTEAAGALVWMAAKAIQKIFFESDKTKQQQSAQELKKDIGKMTKALGVELSHLQLDTKTEQRHGLMSEAITNAKQLEQGGQQKEADRLIVSTYNKLSQSARKDYSQYQPQPEYHKAIAQAQAREKVRHSAIENQYQLSNEPKIDRDKNKSISR